MNYMGEITMGRPRKDNVPVSFRLERTVFDKLNQFCEDSGQKDMDGELEQDTVEGENQP